MPVKPKTITVTPQPDGILVVYFSQKLRGSYEILLTKKQAVDLARQILNALYKKGVKPEEE